MIEFLSSLFQHPNKSSHNRFSTVILLRLAPLLVSFTASCLDGSSVQEFDHDPQDFGITDYSQADIPVWEAGQYTIDCEDGGMCLVPAGSFWMGCNSSFDNSCDQDELPYHEVVLSSFLISRTEVTQSEYATCVAEGQCYVPDTGGYFCNWGLEGRDQHPVNCVTRAMAEKYCAWTGRRLPTEAEWEKAARGTDGRVYPWGNGDVTCAVGVNSICAESGTKEVCSRTQAGDSPYGLCDMAGNVAEWVSDWYAAGYYTKSPSTNPTGPVDGDDGIVRGGSFDSGSLRASSRQQSGVEVVNGKYGFRCARTSL